MKFYFDECFSFRLVDAINSLVQPKPYDVVHTVRDMVWKGLPDTEWIVKLSFNEENFILTRDPHQRTREAERKAWMQANAVMFFFPRQWIIEIGLGQAWKIIRWWPEIERTAAHSPKGVSYRIPFKGTPSRLHPWQD